MFNSYTARLFEFDDGQFLNDTKNGCNPFDFPIIACSLINVSNRIIAKFDGYKEAFDNICRSINNILSGIPHKIYGCYGYADVAVVLGSDGISNITCAINKIRELDCTSSAYTLIGYSPNLVNTASDEIISVLMKLSASGGDMAFLDVRDELNQRLQDPRISENKISAALIFGGYDWLIKFDSVKLKDFLKWHEDWIGIGVGEADKMNVLDIVSTIISLEYIQC